MERERREGEVVMGRERGREGGKENEPGREGSQQLRR